MAVAFRLLQRRGTHLVVGLHAGLLHFCQHGINLPRVGFFTSSTCLEACIALHLTGELELSYVEKVLGNPHPDLRKGSREELSRDTPNSYSCVLPSEKMSSYVRPPALKDEACWIAKPTGLYPATGELAP